MSSYKLVRFSGRLYWRTAANRTNYLTSTCGARWCHRVAAGLDKVGGKFPATRRRSTNASSSSTGNLSHQSNLHLVILYTTNITLTKLLNNNYKLKLFLNFRNLTIDGILKLCRATQNSVWRIPLTISWKCLWKKLDSTGYCIHLYIDRLYRS